MRMLLGGHRRNRGLSGSFRSSPDFLVRLKISMRLCVPTRQQLVMAVLASCIGIGLPAQQPPRASQGGRGLLLQHVQVFDPTSGAFSDTLDILVRGERIAAVGRLGPPGPGMVHVDAGGKYALPGLWDSHVHLSFLTLGGDTAVARTLAAFVRHGITSVRDVGGQLARSPA
jgi:hypothetical protein